MELVFDEWLSKKELLDVLRDKSEYGDIFARLA
jgi:hypothetical protein